MIPSSLILLGTLLSSAEAGVPVPEGVLTQAPAAQVSTIRAPAGDGLADYAPPPEPAELLVGRAAWLEQKFVTDPVMSTDHGRPTVMFEVNDPALRR